MIFELNTSEAGLGFIEKNEGLAITIRNDVGHQMIGYGHDLTPAEISAGKWKGGITMLDAALLLEEDVAKWDAAINAHHLALAQSQHDALADFTHNLGVGSLNQLLAHGVDQVPSQLLRWDHEGSTVVAGLLARRQAEVAMWNA